MKSNDKINCLTAYNHMLSIVKKRPLDINIETVNTCPQRCVFCPNRKNRIKPEIMDMDLFKKICEDYYNIGGGGIALCSMHSDVFTDPMLLERLEFIKKLKDKFYLYTTNPLILINKYDDEKLKIILDTFDYITVSVLGLNREDFIKICGRDKFDVFYDNLYKAKNIIDKNNLKTKINLGFRTYRLLKYDKIYQQLITDFPQENIIDKYFSWHGTINQSDLPSGAKIVYKDNTQEKENCAATVSTLSIMPNGDVPACGCVDWNLKSCVGNVYENDLISIWNSDNYIRFRDGFSNGNIPKICHECALYTSIKNAYSNTALLNFKPTDGIYWTLSKGL